MEATKLYVALIYLLPYNRRRTPSFLLLIIYMIILFIPFDIYIFLKIYYNL